MEQRRALNLVKAVKGKNDDEKPRAYKILGEKTTLHDIKIPLRNSAREVILSLIHLVGVGA